jgi:queuine tRNA-ribosyltransferase
VRAIGAGVDIFDCVIPTRNARNGQAFTLEGRIALRNARHRSDPTPLEAGCPCPACSQGYGRGYLRHLHLAREMSAARLVTLHNLSFYARLVGAARAAVLAGDYEAWATRTLARLDADAFPDRD